MVYVLVFCRINYFVTNTHLLDKLVWVIRSSEELSLITSVPSGSARKRPVDVACALRCSRDTVREKVLNIKDNLECF